ncbi:unnamed protein product [marine sediment metagenome]|uniref:Uncharacterized protein n=1 Tax=marine sediment metagenome TaxID=412755 RepID=X1CBV8_9ZZZZ
MRTLITIIAFLAINFANAQKIYKEIQGEYENPIIGDITIEGYELTYRGFTHIYQSETDNRTGNKIQVHQDLNYDYYKRLIDELAIAQMTNPKYMKIATGKFF